MTTNLNTHIKKTESIGLFFLLKNNLLKKIEGLFEKNQTNFRETYTLYFISKNEKINQKQLCDLMKMNRTSMTLTIDSLQSKNFVFRENLLNDRRQNIIKITDSGIQFLEKQISLIHIELNSFLKDVLIQEQSTESNSVFSFNDVEILDALIKK